MHIEAVYRKREHANRSANPSDDYWGDMGFAELPPGKSWISGGQVTTCHVHARVSFIYHERRDTGTYHVKPRVLLLYNSARVIRALRWYRAEQIIFFFSRGCTDVASASIQTLITIFGRTSRSEVVYGISEAQRRWTETRELGMVQCAYAPLKLSTVIGRGNFGKPEKAVFLCCG